MTHDLQVLQGMISCIIGSIIGNQVFVKIGIVVANVTQEAMPIWMTYIMGPFGALVGLVIALIWFNKRLEKTEAKLDKREDERDIDRKTLIALLESTKMVIEKNTETNEDIKSTVLHCKANNIKQ